MPDAAYAWVITCPANTPTTAPTETPLTGLDAIVPKRVTITIPDGHAGLTGIGVGYGHAIAIPANSGQYISGNDWTFAFDLTGYPNGVSWSAITCNLDTQPHSWQVIFEGNVLPGSNLVAVSQPINTADLAALQDQQVDGA